MPRRAELLPWRAVTFAVCGLVLAGNAWHILHQAAPPSWDDAWYLEVSFRLFYALRESLWAAASAYAHAFQTKAPLISLLPLPLYALFGPGERTALWANQLLLPFLWLGVYHTGRKLFEEKAALAAVCAAALSPLLNGLSRHFLVETVLTTLVCWSHYAILSAKREEPRGARRRGALLGAGLLAKSIFPLYIAGALWLKRKDFSRRKLTLSIAAAVASTWYAFNAITVVAFGLSAGFGPIAQDYGSPLSWDSLRGYALSLGQDALSWPWLWTAALLAAVAGRRALGSALQYLSAWLLLPFFLLALSPNKEIRFLAPALPALALASGAWAAACAVKRPWLPALALLPSLLAYGSQTFGVPEAKALAYNGAPGVETGWDRSALVEAVAASAKPDSVIAVGLEHRLLNANNLSCLAASRGYRFRFVSLGYGQTSAEGALIRLKDKGADHLIMVEGLSPQALPAFLNRANEGVRQRLASGALPAKLLARLPLAKGLEASLFVLGR